MTGIDAPYEAPSSPELVIRPDDPADPVAAVLTAIGAEP
jgi:adenylylsulfate kinase-like enzyme